MRYSFYHRETGAFHNTIFETDDLKQVEINTPSDHVAIEGNFDPQNQRFDTTCGKVVNYQPPAPSPEHEWNAATRRWVLSDVARWRNEVRAAALARIAVLEVAQHRPMRELALNQQDTEARKRLEIIEAEIAMLRVSADA